MSTKKVCIISGFFKPQICGIADYAWNFTLMVAKFKAGVIVVTSKMSNLFHKKYQIKNVEILRIIKSWNILGICNILGVLTVKSVDVVYIQFAPTHYNCSKSIFYLPFLIKIRWPNRKVVGIIHDFYGEGRLWNLSCKVFFYFLDRIILASEADREAIIRLNKMFNKKISVVPVGPNIHPVDLPESQRIEIRQRFGVNDTALLISFFGFLFANKEIQLLIETSASLIKQGYKIKLILIGGGFKLGGECHESLRQIIKKIHLESHIFITGFMDELEAAQHLLSSDICVLPFPNGVTSKNGSFISVTHLGLPIVTTKGMFTPSNLVHKENIMLYEPGYGKGLEECLIDLINLQELRNRLHTNILKFAQDNSWEKIVGDIMRQSFEC